MNYKQYEKINQEKESTLVVGIDIGSTTQYARAFDWRGIELGKQLKHAKSKEEADRIISFALSGISKNDPDREYIFAAVNRISTEFHKSGAYEKLPNTVEEGDKEGKESGDIFSDADDKEDDGFDLKKWSPLREVYDSMPTFSVGA